MEDKSMTKRIFKYEVTVLMSVYWGDMDKEKAERYLRRAIKSILDQTYKLFVMIIVIDDPENQEKITEIIKSFKSYRIDAFANDENIGVTHSLNRALHLIESRYIMRQDMDDYSDPQRLAKQLSVMENDKTIGAIGDNYAVVDEKGHKLATNAADPEKLSQDRLAGSIAGGGTMVRTEVVKEIGGWKYQYAQDFYMWVKMRQAGHKVVSLKETVYFYTQHKDQISVAKRNAQKECHQKIEREICNGINNSSNKKQ